MTREQLKFAVLPWRSLTQTEAWPQLSSWLTWGTALEDKSQCKSRGAADSFGKLP